MCRAGHRPGVVALPASPNGRWNAVKTMIGRAQRGERRPDCPRRSSVIKMTYLLSPVLFSTVLPFGSDEFSVSPRLRILLRFRELMSRFAVFRSRSEFRREARDRPYTFEHKRGYFCADRSRANSIADLGWQPRREVSNIKQFAQGAMASKRRNSN